MGSGRRAADGLARPWQRLVGWLELPEEVMLDLPRATVIGRERCLIENHRGLVRFTAHEVVVQSRLGPLRVMGDRLEIERLAGEELVLRGRIDQIDYPSPAGRRA
ncbi:sporulation protein [Limnochorda pilosa]|uniref:Sporulation protein n=1 Tax=Limnochorda pilosa TaxID=1555112 RepID=A0A0K2SMW7_LIMPI|nr:sporulation protein [Limnochorda pilosa]